MIYYWDSLSCLHHPPLTFSSCRLFPSRSFCLPSLAVLHSSMGPVLNRHLSVSITCFSSPFAVNYQWEKKRYKGKERRESKKSTFSQCYPFSLEENCLGFKWGNSTALFLHCPKSLYAIDPCFVSTVEIIVWMRWENVALAYILLIHIYLSKTRGKRLADSSNINRFNGCKAPLPCSILSW